MYATHDALQIYIHCCSYICTDRQTHTHTHAHTPVSVVKVSPEECVGWKESAVHVDVLH